MPSTPRRPNTFRSIVGLAALCIVLAGLKLAADIIVPVLLAMVIAVVCLPTLKWLQNRRVPTPIAIALILLAVAVVGLLVPMFVGASLRELLANFGHYQEQFKIGRASLIEQLNNMGIIHAGEALKEWPDPAAGKQLLEWVAKEVALWFIKAFAVLLLVAFMLAEASHFPAKVQAAFPGSKEIGHRIAVIIENIWRYLAIKTIISLVTGGLVAILLAIFGVRFPLLWGFVAYCFNYIPNVGSVIAAIPALLLALLDNGPGAAIGVGIGYVAIHASLGAILEPRLQGRGLGLSPLVVLVSLLFWGFVLGMVGALLSAPLTMAVRIACEAFPETRWIAVMLGPKVRDDPRAQDQTRYA